MADDPRKDDPTILDSDRLFRRVKPNQLVRLPDGSFRPSSDVFKNLQMSVNIESLMVGRSPEDTLKGYEDCSLTSVTAGAVRQRGPQFPIVKDNAPPNDPAHGLVLGKKPDSFGSAMARVHQWVVAPK
jgi:hypothetical protein